jgi:hypothetical protein
MAFRPTLVLPCAAAALLVLAAPGLPPPAKGAESHEDIVDLALGWARGGFASPLICRFGDSVHRGIRRIVVTPGPRTSPERLVRVQFFDLDARDAVHCDNELGGDEPNVIGALYLTYVAKRPRSDTPERDFKEELGSGALTYPIVRGALRVGPVQAAAEGLRLVDFSGGKAELRTIKPGSDNARRLGDLPGNRRMLLELDASDGTHLAFPMVEYESR